MPRITFKPSDIAIETRKGETILDAAMRAGVPINATCGGAGTCGKCRVIVEHGQVVGGRGPKLSAAYADAGHVLACIAEARSDVIITVPPESTPGEVPGSGSCRAESVLSAEEIECRLPSWQLQPPVRRMPVQMAPADLTDNADDAQRLRQALRGSDIANHSTLSLEALRRLPHAARAASWGVEALLCTNECHTEVADIRPASNSTSFSYGIALDLGTTTVVAQLLDLSDGHVMAEASEYNAQIAHGADVISRIVYASTNGGLETLRDLALNSIRSVVESVMSKTGVRADDIVSYVVAGNTVMTHILLGLTPTNIRSEPYVPVASTYPWMRAEEFGLPCAKEARMYALPCPASYVGGDIVGGVLAAGIPWSEKLVLYIDIGTNGEIVLGNKDWTVACACSAGPAFEGGGVLHGMRAADGAIEQVRIDRTTLEPMLLTIGHTQPLGICGSGFVDCAAELFLAKAIDRNGKFDREREGARGRIRESEHGWEYVLVRGHESGTGRDIVVTESDIENLIRAKAAVFAGMGVLMESVDVGFEDIDEVLVAGGFGRYLELDEVVTLGLLPELPTERFSFVGNGSLRGARLVALSGDMLKTAEQIASGMTYIELSINAAFMDMYVSAMFLPHTDLTLFPSVAERLAAKTVAR